MRVTYDAEVDAAYISLKPIAAGESKRQVPVRAEGVPGDIVLDVDGDGRLIGIEILGAASSLPSELLAEAERL